MRLLLLFLSASVASAEARATLHVRPSDRAVAVRAPAPDAVASVFPKGAATATLEVVPAPDGYWHFDANSLKNSTVAVGGVPFLVFVEGPEKAVEATSLLEAGDTAFEVPVASTSRPGDCLLRVETPETSIRQELPGADVLISGEANDARAVFLAHVGADQVGPATVTLRTAAGERSWPMTLYAWRWVAERRSIAKGEAARFRLEIAGLPAGAACDITLEVAGSLALETAPGTFSLEAPGRYAVRGTEGTFVFRSSTEGECAVTADLKPCGR